VECLPRLSVDDGCAFRYPPKLKSTAKQSPVRGSGGEPIRTLSELVQLCL